MFRNASASLHFLLGGVALGLRNFHFTSCKLYTLFDSVQAGLPLHCQLYTTFPHPASNTHQHIRGVFTQTAVWSPYRAYRHIQMHACAANNGQHQTTRCKDQTHNVQIVGWTMLVRSASSPCCSQRMDGQSSCRCVCAGHCTQTPWLAMREAVDTLCYVSSPAQHRRTCKFAASLESEVVHVRREWVMKFATGIGSGNDLHHASLSNKTAKVKGTARVSPPAQRLAIQTKCIRGKVEWRTAEKTQGRGP